MDDLNRTATYCCDLLIQGISECEYVEGIIESYLKAAPQLREGTKEMTLDDSKRVFFELICFGAFMLMTTQAPKHITRSHGILRKPRADVVRVREFNSYFIDHLVTQLKQMNFYDIHEIEGRPKSNRNPEDRVLEYGAGPPLDADRRIAEYDLLASRQGFDHFCVRVGMAVDAEYGVIGMVIGATIAPVLGQMVESLTHAAFTQAKNPAAA